MAGAVGTTALNAITSLDMAVRARPASSTPEDAVRRPEDLTGVSLSEQVSSYVNAGIPVMSRPTIRAWMLSVPS